MSQTGLSKAADTPLGLGLGLNRSKSRKSDVKASDVGEELSQEKPSLNGQTATLEKIAAASPAVQGFFSRCFVSCF